MRIVVAPDSFKGSLSAVEVAEAMEQGILSVLPDTEVIKMPIADGGEGTVEALVLATGGSIISQIVTGPLGEMVKSHWGLLGDGNTAVIEMAAASGLTLIPENKRNPRITTTYGTGELIKAALNKGIRKIIIGIGGSATNDGGVGMAQALGVNFLDSNDCELRHGGAALINLAKIDTSKIERRLAETQILVACDVDNPLYGPHGATAVYGQQKGATSDMLMELDKALQKYAIIAQHVTGRDVSMRAGAGAAGGLGAGLMFFADAVLRPGVEIILDAIGFAGIVQGAALVITGEGCTDHQTIYGKAPIGVAKAAKQFNIPVVCLSGSLGKGCEAVLQQGIDGLMSITPQPMTIKECMDFAPELIKTSTARLCQLLKTGMKMGNNIAKHSEIFHYAKAH